MGLVVYSDREKEILESGRCSFAGLVKVETPEPARLWTGNGDIVIVNSAFDPGGATYLGSERLLTVPNFQRLVNAVAQRTTYTLSGATDKMADYVEDHRAEIHDAIVRFGLVVLGDNYGQVGPVRWLRRARCDMIAVSNNVSGGIRTRIIELSVGTLATGRKVPNSGTFTNADQQQRSPGDRFCERTSLMRNMTEKAWKPDS